MFVRHYRAVVTIEGHRDGFVSWTPQPKTIVLDIAKGEFPTSLVIWGDKVTERLKRMYYEIALEEVSSPELGGYLTLGKFDFRVIGVWEEMQNDYGFQYRY